MAWTAYISHAGAEGDAHASNANSSWAIMSPPGQATSCNRLNGQALLWIDLWLLQFDALLLMGAAAQWYHGHFPVHTVEMRLLCNTKHAGCDAASMRPSCS